MILSKKTSFLTVSMLALNVAGVIASSADKQAENPIDLYIAEANRVFNPYGDTDLVVTVELGRRSKERNNDKKHAIFADLALEACKRWKLTPNDCEAGVDCCNAIEQLRRVEASIAADLTKSSKGRN
jgi:hypothetical protein